MLTSPDLNTVQTRDVIQPATGIYPVTSLGISFYYHSKIDLLICRKDGVTAQLFAQNPQIQINAGNTTTTVDITGQFSNGLVEAMERKVLPAVILCTPPYEFLDNLVEEVADLALIMYKVGHLKSYHRLSQLYFPNFLLASNGIIYDETISKLTVYLKSRHLPDEVIDKVTRKIIRTSVMQAAYRQDSLYFPHLKGLLKLAIPKFDLFKPVVNVLNEKSFTFSVHTNPYRVEFEKAIVNIATNSLAMIFALNKEQFKLEPITIEESLAPDDPYKIKQVKKIQEAVFNIGKKAGAYSATDSFENIWLPRKDQILKHDGTHISSSLQCFKSMIKTNKFPQGLSSPEQALILPLKYLAEQSGLGLEHKIMEDLELSILNTLDFARHNSDKIETF